MIERTYHCEGPADNDEGRCTAHGRTATPPPHLPAGFIEARCVEPDGAEVHHFCSWDCAMKFAAVQPVAEVIPWEGE